MPLGQPLSFHASARSFSALIWTPASGISFSVFLSPSVGTPQVSYPPPLPFVYLFLERSFFSGGHLH